MTATVDNDRSAVGPAPLVIRAQHAPQFVCDQCDAEHDNDCSWGLNRHGGTIRLCDECALEQGQFGAGA